MNRHFSPKDIQMANMHTHEKMFYIISLRETQIKTMMKY